MGAGHRRDVPVCTVGRYALFGRLTPPTGFEALSGGGALGLGRRVLAYRAGGVRHVGGGFIRHVKDCATSGHGQTTRRAGLLH